jgi:hypothetical protein
MTNDSFGGSKAAVNTALAPPQIYDFYGACHVPCFMRVVCRCVLNDRTNSLGLSLS